MKREEYIANMISFVWKELGVNLLPEGESTFVYVLFALLDDAIESEVRAVPSLYEQAKRVSLN
jgi:hypothetical protein